MFCFQIDNEQTKVSGVLSIENNEEPMVNEKGEFKSGMVGQVMLFLFRFSYLLS